MNSERRASFTLILLILLLGLFSITGISSSGLEIEEGDRIDMGVATEGEVVRGDFTVINQTEAAVEVYNFIVSCSCIKILSENPGSLQSGESARVEFEFYTSHYGGRKTTKEIMIFTSASDQPNRLQVSIEVKERKDYQALPQDFFRHMRVLVDVRPKQVYDQGHILGAVNIASERLREYLSKIPADVSVCIYSQSGKVSDRLVAKLRDEVSGKLISLVGGYDQWMARYEEYVTEGAR